MGACKDLNQDKQVTVVILTHSKVVLIHLFQKQMDIHQYLEASVAWWMDIFCIQHYLASHVLYGSKWSTVQAECRKVHFLASHVLYGSKWSTGKAEWHYF